MPKTLPREFAYRQLNLGYCPEPLLDGLDLFATRADLSRAQLVRRILTAWLTEQVAVDDWVREATDGAS